MSPNPFDHRRRGYVIGSTGPVPAGHTITSWWYGPERGFGTTWGSLDYSVAMFATRAGARLAAGRHVRRDGWKVYSVAQALEHAYTELTLRHAESMDARRADEDQSPERFSWWCGVLDAQRRRLDELERWIKEAAS